MRHTALDDPASDVTSPPLDRTFALTDDGLLAEDGPEAKVVLQDMPEEDRPRERLLRSGGHSLSDAELVAVLLRTGRPGQCALDMARQILKESHGLTGLPDATARSLDRPGLRQAKAATLLAAVEIGRRLARAEVPRKELLDRADKVVGYLALRYFARDHEVMGALYLDVRNRLLAERELYRGTVSRMAVEPRAILKDALVRGAASFVLFHTHPSGDPAPSAEDLTFTRRMARASRVVGIRMVDHLILGGTTRWVSMRERGIC